MRRIKDKYMIRCKGSEGSSLAIALFFFLLCSLMCAGILFLANSSSRGVSKSLANAPVFEKPATPPAGTIQPGMTNEELAVQIVYDSLYNDLTTITANHDKRISSTITRDSSPILYPIFYQMWSNGEWDNGEREYTVQLELDGKTYTDVTVKINAIKYNNILNSYFRAKGFEVVVSAGEVSQSFAVQVKNGQYRVNKDVLFVWGDDFIISGY